MVTYNVVTTYVTKHIEYLGAVSDCHGPEGPPWILHAVLVAALCQDRPENLVRRSSWDGSMMFEFLPKTYRNMMKYGGFP